jgi:hypothetical protein
MTHSHQQGPHEDASKLWACAGGACTVEFLCACEGTSSMQGRAASPACVNMCDVGNPCIYHILI